MTWHSLFDLSTMEHRHLLIAYIAVWTVQIGYLGWITFQWRRTKKPRD
ncbi:MAG: hypothetical protein J0G35_18810 [Acidobacteriales bacterium]|nr:hypothetical protein [Terriglobales bacterium]